MISLMIKFINPDLLKINKYIHIITYFHYIDLYICNIHLIYWYGNNYEYLSGINKKSCLFVYKVYKCMFIFQYDMFPSISISH